MKQTIDEMRAAFDAFEREGKIRWWDKCNPVFLVTSNPSWNFDEKTY